MKLNVLRKKNHPVFETIFLFILILFIASCAQIGAPSGGAYDRTPPKTVRYRPDSATVNFNANSIEITFNEFIQLQELNNQLLISPPLEYTPEITAKKKTLFIVFNKKEVLKPNTTYSISFGNAVKDIRESNALENFRYIFSTGSFIDSLTLSGSVQNAFDHKTEKNLLVMLYSNTTDDSVIYKNIPDYFAKTNDAGAFKINNIRQGKYRVVALKDVNSNYKYNEDEAFGFLDSLVDVGNNTKDVFVYIYNEAPKRIFLKKYAQQQYGKFQLVFNQGSDSINVRPLNDALKTVKTLAEYSKTKDTLLYWIDPVDKDSLILQVNNGSTILDTVRFKLVKKENALKPTGRNPLKLTLTNSANADPFDLNKELRLIFSHPLEKINGTPAVLLKEDSIAYSKYPLVYEQSSDPHSVFIHTSKKIDSKNPANTGSSKNMLLKENTTYSLTILPATFTDFFGLTNDTINMKFHTREEKFYGSVKIHVKSETLKGNYILQLLNDKEMVVRESILSKPEESVFYDFLYPSSYKLKIIFDKNANGKWDTGNYLKQQQPEKVIYNVETVNIRSNWDLELEWSIIEPK